MVLFIIVNYQLLAADALRMLYREILVRGSIEPCQNVNNFLGKEGNALISSIRKISVMRILIFISYLIIKVDYIFPYPISLYTITNIAFLNTVFLFV